MFKNLNQAVVAQNGLPFIVRARPTANQRSKQITTILLIIAIAVLAVGGGLGYLLFSQIAGAQSDVINLQAQEGSSAQIAKRYQTTLQSYNDTANQLEFLEASVSQKLYVPTLLQQLQTLAATTHLQVVSVKPGPLASLSQKPAAPLVPPAPGVVVAAPAKVVPPPYDTQPVNITVSGTYRQIMTFVYDMPRFPKIMSLQGIQFRPVGTAKTAAVEPQLTATLLVNAYVFDASNTPIEQSAAAPAPGTFSAIRSTEDDVTSEVTNTKPATTFPSITAVGPAQSVSPGSTK